jgi:hypothetical protein
MKFLLLTLALSACGVGFLLTFLLPRSPQTAAPRAPDGYVGIERLLYQLEERIELAEAHAVMYRRLGTLLWVAQAVVGAVFALPIPAGFVWPPWVAFTFGALVSVAGLARTQFKPEEQARRMMLQKTETRKLRELVAKEYKASLKAGAGPAVWSQIEERGRKRLTDLQAAAEDVTLDPPDRERLRDLVAQRRALGGQPPSTAAESAST